jgi:hypothetical protein
MKINSRLRYDPFNFKKLPFLKKVGDRVFNGRFEVTDAADRIPGIVTGEEEIRLKDYLVYRPLPKAIVKLREKPDVHPDSYDMQIWYQKVWAAVHEGIHVDGEYYNPIFVFWLVLFTFEVQEFDDHGNVLPDESKIDRPTYSVIDRYIFDNIWKAYKQRKYIALMSGRGIGKSYITVCITEWYYMLFDNQEIIISGTSEDITSEAWSKVQSSLKFIEDMYPGLSQKKITDSNKKIVAGEIYYDNHGNKKERGSLNEISRIIYGDNPNSTRGRRPHFQHIEEFAAFPSHPSIGSLKNVIGQSKGSWLIQGSIKRAFVMFTGTGGSVNNKDAEDIFTNPDGFNILAVQEWGDQYHPEMKTGLFIPSTLKYGGTWESYGTPDVELATALMLKNRESLKKDHIAYIQELQEFPITLDEVFMRKGTNIFNQDKLAEQIVAVKTSTKKAWKVGNLEYILDKHGNVEGVRFVETSAGKFTIIEEPLLSPDGNPYKGLYVGGVDSIDQGNNDSLVSGSKLACAIKKRIPPEGIFSGTNNLYVAFYNHRSDDIRWDYDNILKLSMYYNSRLNVEYTKINIISYFREKKQFHRIMKRPSIAVGSNISGAKASMLIGTPANSTIIDHQDDKIKAYIDDYYYQIFFLPLLEQLKDYSREDRTPYDLVIAMGLAELADEDFIGKPPVEEIKASRDLEVWGIYRDSEGVKRWGVIPSKNNNEFNSIAEEEYEALDVSPLNWVEPGSKIK